LANSLKKIIDSPIFWLALAVIIPLFCLVGIRSVFINWGFTADEGLFLSIMLVFPILLGAYTIREITNMRAKETLQKSHRPAFYRLAVSRKNWWWRVIVFLVAVFSLLTAYKYLLSADFTRAFVVVAICGLSVYTFSMVIEILTYTSKPPLTKQS
jgi:hypothetical protein